MTRIEELQAAMLSAKAKIDRQQKGSRESVGPTNRDSLATSIAPTKSASMPPTSDDVQASVEDALPGEKKGKRKKQDEEEPPKKKRKRGKKKGKNKGNRSENLTDREKLSRLPDKDLVDEDNKMLTEVVSLRSQFQQLQEATHHEQLLLDENRVRNGLHRTGITEKINPSMFAVYEELLDDMLKLRGEVKRLANIEATRENTSESQSGTALNINNNKNAPIYVDSEDDTSEDDSCSESGSEDETSEDENSIAPPRRLLSTTTNPSIRNLLSRSGPSA